MKESIELDNFVGLQPKWQELLPTCPNNDIFVTPQWQMAWWQVFGKDYESLLLSVYDDRDLVGIAPLKRQGDRLSFIGSPDVCDYMDFIARRGQEDYVFSKLLDYLEKLAWRSLELDSLLPQSLALKFFVPLAKQKGYQVEITQTNVSPHLLLPQRWEDYLSFAKNQRPP